MKANELYNERVYCKGTRASATVDVKTAKAMVEYACTNWKACFSKEEKRQAIRDILEDADVLKTYLKDLAENIDTMRERHFYDSEAIVLYNQGKAILKYMNV
jgi:fibrillarin-like rRNA methylase